VMDAIWPNKKYPMVFCHVEGTERTQTVTTHEANEESRSNEEERRHVVQRFNASSVILRLSCLKTSY